MHSWCRILSTLALISSAVAVPAPSSSVVSSAPAASPTVPYASDDPNFPLWNEYEDITPEPMRGTLGGTVIGPQNVPLDLENPDLLAPPTTDSGDV
jgi:hypothetical protein